MHECPNCGQACDCDFDDCWFDDQYTLEQCTHVCDEDCEEDDEDFYDDREDDEELIR